MGLGNIVGDIRKNKSSSLVFDLLRDRFCKIEKTYPMKPDDWIRVSHFPYMCPREEVICAREDIVRERRITEDNEWFFGVGHALHYLFQSRFLGPQGALLGMWMCMGCGKKYGGPGNMRTKHPGECDCGVHDFIIREDTVEDHELRIIGHYDGVIQIPGKEPVAIVDFKSMNKFYFMRTKDRPVANHVLQLNLYMWLTGFRHGVLVYINKQELKLRDAIREFWIEYDERMIADAQEKIQALKEGLDGGPMPTRICASRNAKRAVGCKTKARCFLSDNGN